MVDPKAYDNQEKPAWCPGCGNFAILPALKTALAELGKEPHEVLVVSGIGQAAKLPQYMKCNMFNGLHGRSIPVATAAKVVNPKLTVLAVSGDGDHYGEGGNHFMHAIRRNPDITVIVHDNQVYGLTKGQASPTSDWGFVTKVQPTGVHNQPLRPLALAIILGASFVSRGFAGDRKQLVALLKEAITHRGFALVDVLQPCVTFNKVNTYQWYRDRVYKLDDEKNYDPTDRWTSLKKAEEWEERIPIGVLYRQERPAYEDQWPALQAGPLVKQNVDPMTFSKAAEEFM